MTLEKQLKVSRAFRFSGLLMKYWGWGSAKVIWVGWFFAMEGILVIWIKKLEVWYLVLCQLSGSIFKFTLHNKGNQKWQLNFVGSFVLPQLGDEMYELEIGATKHLTFFSSFFPNVKQLRILLELSCSACRCWGGPAELRNYFVLRLSRLLAAGNTSVCHENIFMKTLY